MAKQLAWVKEPQQRVWIWIAAAFALFYFGEALLFWGPQPRLQAPAFTPLVYWGAFGATVIWLLRRQGKGPPRPSAAPRGLQSAVLGIGITLSVIGLAFLVIRVTGNITLGHAVLLGALFEAAVVIGGMEANLGWLGASLVWAAAAGAIFCWPAVQDYILGAAVAAGFLVVGLVPWAARTGPPEVGGTVS